MMQSSCSQSSQQLRKQIKKLMRCVRRQWNDTLRLLVFSQWWSRNGHRWKPISVWRPCWMSHCKAVWKLKKSRKLIRWAPEHYVRCFAVMLVLMMVVGGHTELIEGSALLPVGRQSSCVIKQGKPFPWLSILQVQKQLVVLQLSGRKKINNYSKCITFHIIPTYLQLVSLCSKTIG